MNEKSYHTATAIRCGHIAGSVVWSAKLPAHLSVSFHHERFVAHTIDRHRIEIVRNGRIACLDFPYRRCKRWDLSANEIQLYLELERSWQCDVIALSYRRTWIEHNFGTVRSEHHPVLWMMTSIAYVHRDATKVRLEYRVSKIALRVERGLIVTSVHRWQMVFSMFPKIITAVCYDNGRVPQNAVRVTFQYRRHNHHIILLGELQKRFLVSRPLIVCFDVFTCFRNIVLGPVSTSSAKSIHGCDCCVHRPNGISNKKTQSLQDSATRLDYVRGLLTPRLGQTDNIHFGCGSRQQELFDFFEYRWSLCINGGISL